MKKFLAILLSSLLVIMICVGIFFSGLFAYFAATSGAGTLTVTSMILWVIISAVLTILLLRAVIKWGA